MESIKNFFFNKLAARNGEHPLYIIPTPDGLKVLSLNFLLLVIGLVYANNYVLLFNFILFCLCISSMFYTHFNLSRLKLENIHISNLFANEAGEIKLNFSAGDQGHYFVACQIVSEDILTLPGLYNLKSGNSGITLPVKPLKRGKLFIRSVYIETVFPLNFFKCFTFFQVNKEFLVYPERVSLPAFWEIKGETLSNDDAEDFQFREYVTGESMQRIDWKRFAKNNELYIRHWNYNDHSSVILGLKKETEPEDSLKAICFRIFELQNTNIKYGLQLSDNKLIEPGIGQIHFMRCLEQLALYEI